MSRFSKRAITEAIGKVFRAPFRASPQRPHRRKPLFEQLEPRILLSAEVPVIPPAPLQDGAVLAAPLEFGNDTGTVQAPQQAPQVVRFTDGWGEIDLTKSAHGPLILDLSAVSANLTIDIKADGSVSVTDGVNKASAANVVKLIGGAGDDTFRFEKLPEQPLAIETGGRGTDKLDFSALAADLTYVTHADGTVTVSAGGGAGAITVDRAVATVGGQGRNTFVEEHAPVIAGTLGGGGFSTEAARLSLAAYVATQPAPKQIVIVDAAVQDYQSLLQGLFASTGSQTQAPSSSSASEATADLVPATASPEATEPTALVLRDEILVVVLDPNWDGIEQISQVLAAFQGIAAVHVFSHGSSGAIRLGSTTLNGARLDSLAERLKKWGESIVPGGDLLLYGCDVAAGETGIQFINDLSTLIGADVAASTDLTGSAVLGGDWALEAATGDITATAFSLTGYSGLLATAVFNGTASPDNTTDLFVINDVNVSINGVAATAAGANDNVRVNGLGGNDTFTVNGFNTGDQIEINGGDTSTDDWPADKLDLSGVASADVLVKLKASGTAMDVYDGATPSLRLSTSGVEWVTARVGANSTLDLSLFTGDLRLTAVTATKVEIAKNIGSAGSPSWELILTAENFDQITGLGFSDKAKLVAGLNAVAELGDDLEVTGKLAENLFVLNDQSIGDVFDIGGALRANLADKVNALTGGSIAPSLYAAMVALGTTTGTRISGVVSLDVALNLAPTLKVDLGLGDQIASVVQVDALRGDLVAGLQWSLQLSQTSGGTFNAKSTSDMMITADVDRSNFVGHAGFLGLDFTSASGSTVFLDAKVTLGLNGLTGGTTTWSGHNAATVAQSNFEALAKVVLVGSTTVNNYAVTVPSLTPNISLAGASLNPIDLFTSATPVFTNQFNAAAVGKFALTNAGEVMANLAGFADFLGIFGDKALGIAIPLSADGTTFGDALDLNNEFRENFLALIQRQALTSATPVSTLNNGGGLRTVAGADFKVTLSNGASFNVDLSASDTTMALVIAKIQLASGSSAGGTFEARIDARSGALALVDRTGGGGSVTVEALNQSRAAQDLDLLSPASRRFDDRTLVSDLNGGTGVDTVAGTDLVVTIGSGPSAKTFNVDLNASAGATTLAAGTTLGDLVMRIRNAAPANLASSDWEVVLDDVNFRLKIIDKTSTPATTVVAAVGPAAGDLKINATSGSVGTPLIVAQNIGYQGPSFTSIQELVAKINAGAEANIVGAPATAITYDTSGTPTLKFTATVTLDNDVSDNLVLTGNDIALFDAGALTGMVTTAGTVTINPQGTLTLPFEIQLATLGAGFTLTEATKLSELNHGRGVETVAGADIEVRLSNGAKFSVDLDHDPSTKLLSGLGFTNSQNDVTVTLKDGSTFSVDLGVIGTKTLADLVTALNGAANTALGADQTKFAAKINKARGSLVLIDSTTGGGALTVVTPGTGGAPGTPGTPALGLAGPATKLLDGEIEYFAEASYYTMLNLIQMIRSANTVGSLFSIDIAADGKSLLLRDGTYGSGTFEVAALNGSLARIAIGLTESGDPLKLTLATPISTVNNGLGIGTVGGADIRVTLREYHAVTNNTAFFDVDLNSQFDFDGDSDVEAAATLNDLLKLMKNAADAKFGGAQTKFKVGTPPGFDTPALFDYTTGTSAFSVTNLNSSTAATRLGLTLAAEASVDNSNVALMQIVLRDPILNLAGTALDDDTSSSHIGLRDATLNSNVTITGAGINATGMWGPVEIAVTGGATTGSPTGITFNMEFADSGTDAVDGIASLRELRAGLGDITDLIEASTGVPTGALHLALPVTISPGFGGLTGIESLLIDSANIFNTSVLPTVGFSGSATTTEIFLQKAATLTIAQVLAALDQSADYLTTVQDTNSALSLALPGINRGLGQLLPFGDRFDALMDVLQADPPASLQTLKTALQGLGFTSVSLLYDSAGGGALRVSFTYSPSQASAQRFHLDLNTLDGVTPAVLTTKGLDTIGSIVDIDESSLVDVVTTGTINLAVGVDLAAASHTGFVRDTSTMSFTLNAPQTDLNFSALFGVRSVAITAGSLTIDADGAGSSLAPASYAVAMSGGTNNRHAFASAAGATTGTFTGKIDAILPIVYPLDLVQSGTSTITLVVDKRGAPPGTTTLTATGLNVRDTLSLTGLNGNIQGLRAGFKELFRLLDFAFDAAVFSRELPFVGKQLMDSADFLMQIRDKVGDNFDFITGILTPEKARQALFEAFGPGGLNWLQDKNGDGAVNIADVELIPISGGDDGVEFFMNLAMPQQLLEIPIDLDMILPGLGLTADVRPRVMFGVTMPLRFGISVQRGVYLDKSSIDDMAIKFDVTLPAPAEIAGHKGFLGTLPYRIIERGSLTGLHGNFDFKLKDSDGRLTVNELMSTYGAASSATKAATVTAARGMILGGFTGAAEAHFTLQTDLPLGTALPNYKADLDITNWSFGSTINGSTSTTLTEVFPTIAFDNTQFELVSFMRDFMGPMLKRLEDAMDPLDWIVTMLTNEAFPIVSLILGRAPYTSSNTFGGKAEVGDYAGAAEAISRIVNGNNQSGSFSELASGRAFLVGNPFNPIDGYRPVPFDLIYDPISWINLGPFEFFGMPDWMKAVGPLANLSGTAWIDIGSRTGADFTIDGAAARTSTTQLAPQNVNAREYGKPSASESIDSGSVLSQIRKLAGRNTGQEDLDLVQDAALGFLATQTLPGRGKFEGFFGGGLGQIINAFASGYDPVAISILNDPNSHTTAKSFNLMFGDVKLGGSAAAQDTQLLTYSPPELFLYLYQDIPISPKAAASKVLGELGGHVVKLGIEFQVYIAVAFEARADFGVAMDTTGLQTYAKTRNPGDIVNGVYLDDQIGINQNGPGAIKAVGSNSDPDEAKVVGGVGLGVQVIITFSVIEFKLGVEALVFNGMAWNLHDPNDSDGLHRIRANEFDINNVAGKQVFDRSWVIELRADVFAKLAIKLFLGLKFTIFDIRFNLFTVTFDIPFFLDSINGMPTLGTLSGGVLTANPGFTSLYIGAGDKQGEVWLSSGNQSQLFKGVTSVKATGSSGNDFFYVNPRVSVPVEVKGGDGVDTLTVLRRHGQDILDGGANVNVSFYGEGGNDILTGGAGNDLLDGGAGDDTIYGGDGNDNILGGDGVNTLYGYRGDDHLTGGTGVDTIYGESGFDTIDGAGGNDTLYGGKNNDIIFGGDGTDIIWGGDGRDTLHGGSGNDTIHGELGNDYIWGEAGADTIYGEQNNDTIYGGADNDRLDGQGASDRIYGDNGPTGALLADEGKENNQDVLISGEGDDYLDGQHDSDTYLLTYHGDGANALIFVLDTGSSVGTDIFQVTGTSHDDNILLRANADGAGAFVALLSTPLSAPSAPPSAERINYLGVERITISGSFGNDHFMSDDTSAEVTINGDEGDDTFQIGQIFRSPRTHDSANVSIDDEFATIETTRGYLSNGVSAPMTVNGGAGRDTFTVFHNLAVLSLNGDEGDDTFEVKAFALVGSQEPKRARTDISGGAGTDLVQYAVSAPVNIDGGDGFDTLVAIGTEFGDDLVITEKGVYGAGLNVNFVNIESLRIDGAEGDDRFYIQSTSEKFVTEIFGGLGDDTFSISGDTPPVVSNDLLGHSGIVTNSVESVTDARYDGTKLFGISANVADNDEAGVVIRQTGGSTIIAEGGQTDSYQVVLTRRPTVDIIVKALAPLPTRDQREQHMLSFSVSSSAPGAVNATNGTSVSLRFTPDNWNTPQTVTVGATSQLFSDPAGLLTRPELGAAPGEPSSFSYDDAAYEGVRFGVVNHIVLADVHSVNGQMAADNVLAITKATEARIEIAGTPSGAYTLTIDGANVGYTVVGTQTVSETLNALQSAFNTAKTNATASSPLKGVTALRSVLATVTISGSIDVGDVFSVTIGDRTAAFTVPASGVSTAAHVATALATAVNALGMTGVWADDRAQNGTFTVLAPSTTVPTSSVVDPGANTSATTAAPIQLLILSSEDGDLNTDDSTNFSVAGASIRIKVDGSAGATTTLSGATLDQSLIGRKITVTGGPGAGQQRFVVAIEGTSRVTVDRAWDIDDAPTKESSFQIRVDDALVGRPTAVNNTTFTLTDAARGTSTIAFFPTPASGADGESGSLRGRTLQIVGGAGAGQQRLILSNTATSLTLNGAWDTVPDATSIYRIELFDGLAVPGVSVQMHDNDEPGLIVTESGDGTAVIEGGDEARERDTLTIRLTKIPSGPVTVTVSNPDGQLLPVAPIVLNAANSYTSTFTVSASNDTVREGAHTGLLNFSLSGGEGDTTPPATDLIRVSVLAPENFVGLTHAPSGGVTVTIDGVARTATYASGNEAYRVVGNKVVFLKDAAGAFDAGNFVTVSGNISVTYTYQKPGFSSAQTQPVLVRISDDDAPTVLVRETGGSTDVVEGGARIMTLEFVPTGAAITDNSLVGRTITITSGAGASQPPVGGKAQSPTATIISNTSTTITVQHQWTNLPDASSFFQLSGDLAVAAGNLISAPSSVTGNLTSTVVEYEVFLVAGATYQFSLEGAASSQGTLWDPYVYLLNSAHGSVAEDDDSGAGLNSLLTYTAGATGTYYVQAKAFADRYTGTYRLSINLVGEIPGGTNTGAVLIVPGATTGTIEPDSVVSNDHDWFRVTLEAGRTYTFDLEGSATGAGTLSDPYLYLRNSGGGEITHDDDSGAGYNSQIASYLAPTTGTYYLDAGAFADSSTGTYRLSASVGPRSFDVVSTTDESFNADTYDVVLTAQPTGPVTVKVKPEITKTTRTGGIRNDLVQVTLSSSDTRFARDGSGILILDSQGRASITFSTTNWDTPAVIRVTAIDDTVIDGGDTQVFAPHPNTLSGILGPVFIEGGGGEGSLGLAAAFILPGETNVKVSTGTVVTATATQFIVLTADLQAFLGAAPTTSNLVGKTIEVTAGTNGAAVGQFRQITGVVVGDGVTGVTGETVLTLNAAFTLESGQLVSHIQKYAISEESLNFFVDERKSVDVMFVHDEDSPADSAGVITANTITGFNMGPAGVDGILFKGRFKPFGISYGGLEVVEVNLGRGFNDVKVLGTGTRSDGYRTWTMLNTGDDIPDPARTESATLNFGDTVTVQLSATEVITRTDAILRPAFVSAVNLADGRSTITYSGTPFAGLDLRGQLVRTAEGDRQILSHTGNTLSLNGVWTAVPTGATALNIVKLADGGFALNAGGGNDKIIAGGSTLPLIIFGGLGNDTITGGSGDDIIFGDRGRVDFFGDPDGNGNRAIVTRLGTAPAPITDLATAPFAAGTLSDTTSPAFPVPDADDIGLKGLYVSINNGTGFLQDPRLITNNTANSLTIAPNWDLTLDTTSRYRISTIPEDQTDGVKREAGLLITVDNNLGGNDTINAGAGSDQVFGGAGTDVINGHGGDDVLMGDGGRIDRARDPAVTGSVVFTPGQSAAVVVRTVLDRARTISAGAGSADTISGDGGADVILGGAGGDTLYGDNVTNSNAGADGADVMIGDSGEAVYFTNSTPAVGKLKEARSLSPSQGGNDTIAASVGDNLIIGGFGADTITAAGGADLVMGDNGEFVWYAPNQLDLVQTTSIADGGDDDIRVGDGANIVAGGKGADVIETGIDEDLILGDNGFFNYTDLAGVAKLTEARTTDDTTVTTGTGAGDVIVSGGGSSRNIVLAGLGDDRVNQVARAATTDPVRAVSTGSDIVVGDNGFVTWDTAGKITQFASTQPEQGGNDLIDVAGGANIVVGGFGNDTITTGADADIVLGDNGDVTYTAGTTFLLQAKSTDTANTTGGNDIIAAGEGDNLIMAGVGTDTVTAGSGADLVMGDNGQIDWQATGEYKRFETTDIALGNADDIRVGDGENIVAGGFGADVIETGVDEDLILGDNGFFQYTSLAGVAKLTEARTTDTTAATGGDDVIVSGGGSSRNIVLAGMGADRVNQVARAATTDPVQALSTGSDIVVGDNGFVTWDTAGKITQFASTLPTLGGDDLVDVGDGANIVVGGFGADVITTGADNDIVLGDNGDVTYTAGTTFLLQAKTTDPLEGGNDTITAGDGDNLILAGKGLDVVTAGTGADLVMGDNGQIDWTPAGEYSQFQTSGHAQGAKDTIDVSDGANIVLGGEGDDAITTGADADLIVGDNGSILYSGVTGSNVIVKMESTDTVDQPTWDDVILAGDGANRIVAGMGDDEVTTTGDFADFVMGDNGEFNWDVNGVIVSFMTTQPDKGGVDIIDVADGANIVVGGFGADEITTGGGNDIVLGDNGDVTYTAGTTFLLQAKSTDSTNATGGADIVAAGEGDNLIMAGVGSDTVTAGSGADLVMGDNGQIDWRASGEYNRFETTDLTLGAADDIRVGDGANIVLGGFGGDVVETGVDADLIQGDNGFFQFTSLAGVAILTESRTTDDTSVTSGTGGDDVIVSGGGSTRNIVMGGLGNDRVNQLARAATTDPVRAVSTGGDIVMGDNGFVTWDTAGNIRRFSSILPAQGGDDLIDVGDGANIVVGGFGNDTIATGADADIVLGDDGQVDYVRAELLATPGADLDSTDIDLVESLSTTADGGVDIITTGAGDDIVVGGRFGDTIDAGDGNNLVIGDSGRITAADQNAPQFTGQPITLGLVETIEFGDGGVDTITTGTGNDIVLGGHLGDDIHGGAGQNIVLGDDGKIDYVSVERGATAGVEGAGVDASDIDLIESISTTAAGGVDTITTLGGNDIVIGGRDGDAIDAGDGRNLVIGDSGRITAANQNAPQFTGQPMTFGLVETITFGDGGIDTITTGTGGDIVLGGHLGDTIDAGAGDNLVMGDDGKIEFVRGERVVGGLSTGTTGADVDAGDIDLIESISTTAAGGVDTITTLGGNDIVIGGRNDDTIDAGDGNNLVIGDSGRITAANADTPRFGAQPITLGLIETITFGDGGIDTITTGTGDDIVLGGHLGDDIHGGSGQNIVLGDDGRIDYARLERDAAGTPGADVDASDIDLIESISTTFAGGVDTITTLGGNDIVIGGRDGDTIYGGDGDNLVIGDSGQITAANQDAPQFTGQPMTFGLIETTTFGDGGIDTITTGTGDDIVLGGHLGDDIHGGAGQNIVLGDDGRIDYARLERDAAGTPGADVDASDIDLIESISTTAAGGADTITTLGGNDIVIGGRFGDIIDGGDGDNLVIGDSGQVTADDVDAPQIAGVPMSFGLIETTQIDDGGSDDITTGAGDDIVLAGFAGDTITTAGADDIVFGDNAHIVYTDAVITLLETTDVVAATGGDDAIDAGDGNNIVFAGVGSDAVITGSGIDIVFGDNGRIINDSSGNLFRIVTGDPLLGGNDVISTGDGNDLAFGGAYSDVLLSAGGNDILIGDGGGVVYWPYGAYTLIVSVDIDIGGDDILNGGADNDVIIGGQGDDLMYGNLSEDLLFGSNAALTFSNGSVRTIESDMQDLVSSSLFKEFDELPGDEVEDAIAIVEDGDAGGLSYLTGPLADLFSQPVPLLDVSVFQRLFKRTVVTPPPAPTHGDAAVQGESANPEQGAEEPAPQNGGSEDPAGVPQGELPDAREPTLALAPVAVGRPVARGAEEREESALGAMLSAAGLLAVQQSQTRTRKLLDRDAMARPLGDAKAPSRTGGRTRIEW